MERFIVGRQFLVVLVVFFTNMMASSISGAHVMGLSRELTEIFLNSGVAVILATIMLGQLTAQVNAANCMLDFIQITCWIGLLRILGAPYAVNDCGMWLIRRGQKVSVG